MQTVILCGGLGTRLREETEFRPKPMVRIGPKPILWHIMKIYAAYGHTDFVLPLGYKGEMIRDFFVNYEWVNNDITIELGKATSFCQHNCHEEAGWKITLSDTGPKALKGGRIKRIEKYIEGDAFMLTYGDGVANVDVNALIDFHNKHGRMATLTGVNPMARFGELKIDGDAVRAFHEKPDSTSSESLINGGFFVFNREIFDFLEDSDDCDLEYGLLDKLAGEGEVMVRPHDGFWACMDTLRDTEHLNGIWDSGNVPWKVW